MQNKAENTKKIKSIEERLKHELVLTKSGVITRIIDPLRLELDHKHILHLSNIHIPDMTVHDIGEHGLKTFEYLQTLENKAIRFYQVREKPNKADSNRTNRIGEYVGHVVRKDTGAWLQESLLKQGLAQIIPSSVYTEMSDELLANEHDAIINKRGLWADANYGVVSAETAEFTEGHWMVIEGTIKKTAAVKNTIYLNFGSDYRTDFTVSLSSKLRRAFTQKGIDVLSLTGQTVRVHGWAESYNGLYIDLMATDWLEFIDNRTVEKQKAVLMESLDDSFHDSGMPFSPTQEPAPKKDSIEQKNSVLKRSIISKELPKKRESY
jgi:hypothetical protein